MCGNPLCRAKSPRRKPTGWALNLDVYKRQMQRYLQYDRLQELGMTHFDCWASRFGETVTALELAPEGTGYRARTRFSKFFNLPELMNLFKDCLLYTSRCV